MSERIDHAHLAVGMTGTDWRAEYAIPALLEGQVHATLALAEQQRIANLIALAKLDPSWSLPGARLKWITEATDALDVEFPRRG